MRVMRDKFVLAAFIILVLGAGTAIGLLTAPGAWYAALEKTPFNPPNWIFGPVWSVLYILIGIAGWRIWRIAPAGGAMKIWWLQLALNFLWSPVFFAAHLLGVALVIILALLATLIWFITTAASTDRIAAWLFVPYALWVAFATLLNASLWWLNA